MNVCEVPTERVALIYDNGLGLIEALANFICDGVALVALAISGQRCPSLQEPVLVKGNY